MKDILALSDSHTGHRLGLMPESFEQFEGNKILANELQLALLDCYYKVIDEWKRPDVLVLNGDIIDGTQRANEGIETWSTSINEQVACAEELVAMIKPRRVEMTVGTPYHTGVQKCEQILAKGLGAELHEHLSLEADKINLHFAHHIGVSGAFYRTTAIARELALALFNQKSLHNYTWTLRSHAHYFVHVEFKSHHGFVLPGWQLQTPYAVRKSAFGLIPDIGAIRIRVKGEESYFEKMIWHPPKPKLVKV